FFFFQAEDGIRDWSVTGVQTCALPICLDAARFDHTLAFWIEAARGRYANTQQRKEGIVVRPIAERFSPTLNHRLSFKVINNDFRSEERRVGKECRSQW